MTNDFRPVPSATIYDSAITCLCILGQFEIGILRDIEEEVGRRERGEGQ